jgi:hypothetical protein
MEIKRILSFNKKTDYFSKHVNGLITNFFNNSASQFLPFTTETNLSSAEKSQENNRQWTSKKEKMIDFIIKSTLSLSVLLAVYHTGKRKIHQFNRFYLCLALSFHSVFHLSLLKWYRNQKVLYGHSWNKIWWSNHDHHRRFEGLLAYCALSLYAIVTSVL